MAQPVALPVALFPPLRAGLAALALFCALFCTAFGTASMAQTQDVAQDVAAHTALPAAARAQVGVTVVYDPAYAAMAFPGGDIDRARGVCSDVIIRALRDALGIDLQLAVNRDMRAAFAAYPRRWGLSTTDRNIDHRRVPNLAVLLARAGARLDAGADFLPGDLVTMTLPGNLPHVVILSDRRSADGARPLVIHNIGRGTREEDALFDYPHTGHFRLTAAARARLEALGRP